MAEPGSTLALIGITLGQAVGVYRPLCLTTTGGQLAARFYAGPQGSVALLLLADPEQADPATDRLAERLQELGYTAIVQGYREPANEVACILDALVGLQVLAEFAPGNLALIGFQGGAPLAVAAAQVSGWPLGLIDPVARTGATASGRMEIWDGDRPDLVELVVAWLRTN
jgi:hypothetical protein